jgi:hypothetical protein
VWKGVLEAGTAGDSGTRDFTVLDRDRHVSPCNYAESGSDVHAGSYPERTERWFPRGVMRLTLDADRSPPFAAWGSASTPPIHVDSLPKDMCKYATVQRPLLGNSTVDMLVLRQREDMQ